MIIRTYQKFDMIIRTYQKFDPKSIFLKKFFGNFNLLFYSQTKVKSSKSNSKNFSLWLFQQIISKYNRVQLYVYEKKEMSTLLIKLNGKNFWKADIIDNSGRENY